MAIEFVTNGWDEMCGICEKEIPSGEEVLWLDDWRYLCLNCAKEIKDVDNGMGYS